jgi:hypothetical protein
MGRAVAVGAEERDVLGLDPAPFGREGVQGHSVMGLDEVQHLGAVPRAEVKATHVTVQRLALRELGLAEREHLRPERR